MPSEPRSLPDGVNVIRLIPEANAPGQQSPRPRAFWPNQADKERSAALGRGVLGVSVYDARKCTAADVNAVRQAARRERGDAEDAPRVFLLAAEDIRAVGTRFALPIDVVEDPLLPTSTVNDAHCRIEGHCRDLEGREKHHLDVWSALCEISREVAGDPELAPPPR
jgi:hypothetical protein